MMGLLQQTDYLRKENLKLQLFMVCDQKMDKLFNIYLEKGKVNKSTIKSKMGTAATTIEKNIKLFTEEELIRILSIKRYDYKLNVVENIFNYFKEL